MSDDWGSRTDRPDAAGWGGGEEPPRPSGWGSGPVPPQEPHGWGTSAPPDKDTVWLPRSGAVGRRPFPADGTVVEPTIPDAEPRDGTIMEPTPGLERPSGSRFAPPDESTPDLQVPAADGAAAAPSWDDPEGGKERYVEPEAPAPETVPTRRLIRTPLLVGGAVALVVLGLLVALFVTRPRNDPALNHAASATATAKKGRPDEVVKGYFDALVTGSAGDALSFGAPGPGNKSLLTDDVLNTARKRMPISDVVVTPADENATTVTVTYRIGGQKVVNDVPVIRRDGGYLLDHTTVSVAVNGKRSDNVPLLLNGVKTDAPVVEVFPGYYEATTGLPFIAYEDAVNFKVTALDQKPTVSQLTTKVTPEGAEAMKRRGRISLDTCVKRQELAPQNCPFAVTSNQPIDPASVQRTLDNDPFATFTPLLEPASSTGAAVTEVRTTVSARTTSGSTIKDQKVNTATMRADLAVDAESKIIITWQI